MYYILHVFILDHKLYNEIILQYFIYINNYSSIILFGNCTTFSFFIYNFVFLFIIIYLF